MTILYQKSIGEMMKQPPWPQPEVYHPTVENKRRGLWAVVYEDKDENGLPDANSRLHLIPTVGVHHEISDVCFCDPEIEVSKMGRKYVAHYVTQ